MPWYEPFNVLNPGRPYKNAQKEYSKGWEEAKGYEKPYWQQGIDQADKLKEAQDRLMNPDKMYSDWASKYETSPAAKQERDEANASGMDAASSMGLLGSSSALENVQKTSNNIVQKDRDKYMNDLMQKYMAGLGIGQNMYNTGANMGGQMGNQAMNFGEGMGNLKFGEGNAMMNMMQNFLKMYLASKGGGG